MNSEKEILKDEYFNRITESRKAIEEGKLITQEEAKEYFEKKIRGSSHKYLFDEGNGQN